MNSCMICFVSLFILDLFQDAATFMAEAVYGFKTLKFEFVEILDESRLSMMVIILIILAQTTLNAIFIIVHDERTYYVYIRISSAARFISVIFLFFISDKSSSTFVAVIGLIEFSIRFSLLRFSCLTQLPIHQTHDVPMPERQAMVFNNRPQLFNPIVRPQLFARSY